MAVLRSGFVSAASRRPRIVHVTTTDISLLLLLGPQLRAFASAGYEVIGASAPGPHVQELTSWGIRHEPLANATRSMAPRRDARALLELRTLFRNLAPDLVHTHNPKPGLYGRFAARLARVPAVVNTVHGLYALPEDPFAKRAVVYSLERAAAACSDAELLQNVEDVDVLRRLRVPERKLHLLGNGVDLARFDPDRVDPERVASLRASIGAGPDDIVCGVVGRLVWEKGYQEVFEAAVRLRALAPNVRVVVIGPTDLAKDDAITEDDIARAERDGGIRFLGMRNDLEALYPAMDLYVLASYREGFPRSAMEAAAMGLPLVVTNVRGCRQVVDDGITGSLVPVGDAQALAEAVAAIANDESKRRSMGRAGREKALREFDDRKVIDITLGVYEQLLGTRPAVTA
jgi:glycosyltransferase involved in cell wall biosynthesis